MTDPLQAEAELDEILAKDRMSDVHGNDEQVVMIPGDLTSALPLKQAILDIITKATARAVEAKLREALTVVEEKNDVQILDWFDAELSLLVDPKLGGLEEGSKHV